MAFCSISFRPIPSMTQTSGQCFSERGGDFKGNSFPPSPNPSDLLTQLALTHSHSLNQLLVTCSLNQTQLTHLSDQPLFAHSLDSPLVHSHCQCASAHPPLAYMSHPFIRLLGLPTKPSDLQLFVLYHLAHFIPYLLSSLYSLTFIFHFY